MASNMSSDPQSQTQKQTLPLTKTDDPKITIQHFLNIVNNLHNKVTKSQEKDKSEATGDGFLRQTRSAGLELSQVTGAEKLPLERQTSTPVPGKKSEVQEDHHISKLQRNLRLLKEDVIRLQDLRSEVAEEVWKYIDPLQVLLQKVEKVEKTQLTNGMKKDLDDINKKIFNLMCQVPLLPKKSRKPGGLDSEDGEPINTGKGIVCLLGIHAREQELKKLAVFRYVLGEFKNLDDTMKICLLSFAVFPENQEVNRTMLMYWWIGEEVLSVTGAEHEVKRILEVFVEKQLVEPVENKLKVEPNTYKMSPFVHSSVVLISKEIGLFDMYRKGEKPTMNKSGLQKVCLVEDSSSQQEAKAKKMPAHDIETVFNVSERFPDFAFKWFSEDSTSGKKTFGRLSKPKYKILKVFYLGRWERTAKRHIEVENPDLMKYLRHMTKLKLLSFQGISRIERLDDAVCKLADLIILDLRACYNLEKLPDKIDSLKALIYLDITDCYMIDRMPKRLSWLDNLEVLKGFVVSDADAETVCTLSELEHLTKLRKLTITINTEKCKVHDLFVAIKVFKNLEKLKVAWGGMNKLHEEKGKDGKNKAAKKVKGTDEGIQQENESEVTASADTDKQQGILRAISKKIFTEKKAPGEPGLPGSLRKLDLQCFPDKDLPTYLRPNKLLQLKKLYIKGGKDLAGLGELPEHSICNVEVLRLKFLPKLKVEWRDLSKKYFPKLIFLEKYQCPQVSLCPCDGIGIWRKPKNHEVLATPN